MSTRVGSKVGRRTARRWLSGTVSLAVVLGMGLASAPSASAEDDDDLVAPLPQARIEPYLIAASGNSLVNFESNGESDVVSVSTDRGATWKDVPEHLSRGGLISDGKLTYEVRSDDETTVDLLTYDLATGTSTDPVTFPSSSLEAIGRDYVVYSTDGAEEAEPSHFAAAPVGDPTGAIDLTIPVHTRDLLRVRAGTSDKAVAVSTDRGSGQKLATGYLDVVSMTAGDAAGYAPVSVPGLVDAAIYGEYVYYATGSAKNLQMCRRSLHTAETWASAACVTLRSADSRTSWASVTAGPGWAGVSVWHGDDVYDGIFFGDWTSGKGKVLAPKSSGTVKKVLMQSPVSDLDRPLVNAYTTYSASAIVGYVAKVEANGSVTKFAEWPTAPVEPDQLSLSASRMAGVDGRGSGTAWQRDLGTPKNEQVISKHGLQARVSVGRTAVNGTDGLVLSDQGKQVAKLATWVDLGEMSGPYLLGQATRKATKAAVLAGTKAVAFGKWDYPMALFGSRVATLTFGEDDWWITIFDVATGKPVQVGTVPLSDFQDISSIWMWGDSVIVCGKDDPDADGDQVVVTDFADPNATPLHKAFADGATVGGLGDGVAVIQTGDSEGWQVMNTATGVLTPLDDSADAVPAVDGADHVLYATDTKLVVHELSFAGTSAPRALWTSAATTFNSWAGESAPWKLSVDATKAVGAGSLVITGKDALAGTSVTVPVEASPDGSLRISWDGTLEDGTAALPGTYAWNLLGFDFLTDITGASDVDGVLTVTNKAVTFPQVTPVIDHTKPVTDTVLTADPGAHPSDSTVAYQWYRGTKAIPGATAASYTVAAGDVGKTIKVKVSFSGSTHYLATSKYSASTKKVAKATLTKGTVALDDTTPQVGTPVSAVLDGWGPAPLSATYQWYRVDAKNKAKAISKATLVSYAPIAADAGYRLKVAVTVAKSGYTGASVTSAVSDPAVPA
jgi:hypothetical protein